MTPTTLVIPSWIAQQIADVADSVDEAAGVLLAGVGRTRHGIRLLVRELLWVPDNAYDRRTPKSLSIRSTGYTGALSRAEQIDAVPIWLHTHPGESGVPLPSTYDLGVDDQLREPFRVRSGADVYASLIVSPAEQWFRFSGRVDDGEHVWPIDRAFIVGTRWTLLTPVNATAGSAIPAAFDRQVRAFGGDIQRVLSALRIGVVGCGGTGSAVTEQIVRLGVRRLLMIDPDRVSGSNVTRVYGSTPADVGQPKVRVLAEHLRRVAPDSCITTIDGKVTDEVAARELASCDIVFGCTDDNAGRLVLSRLASYYLVPVVDCGVLLSSDDGQLQGIDGRVTVLTPGEGCLVCRGRVDLARAQAEQLEPAERSARQAEGYAPELGAVEPAVVAYTTTVASFAVAELLERLIGYGPDPEPSEILVRLHEREVSTNNHSPNRRHYCDPATGILGVGDQEPFMGQTWRNV